MSLQLLAKQMEAKGRKGDSMLVHMTADEVAGLQKLAESAGGSLSVNPETGLVEANFLKRMLPTLVGIGLGMTGVGLPAAMAAGALTGGIQAKRNDQDVGMGALLGGLGAMGGANLASGLATAGSSAVTGAGAGAGAGNAAGNIAGNAAGTGATTVGQQVGQDAATQAAMSEGLKTSGAEAAQNVIQNQPSAATAGGDLGVVDAQKALAAKQASPTMYTSDDGSVLSVFRDGTTTATPGTDVVQPATATTRLAQVGRGIGNMGTEGGREAFATQFGTKSAMAGAAPLLAPEKIEEEELEEDDEMYYTEYTPGQTGERSSTSTEARQFESRYSPMERIKADDYMERRNRRYAAEGGLMRLAEGGVTNAAPAGNSGASADAMSYLMGQSPSATGAPSSSQAGLQYLMGQTSQSPVMQAAAARQAQVGNFVAPERGLGGDISSTKGYTEITEGPNAGMYQGEAKFAFDPASQKYYRTDQLFKYVEPAPETYDPYANNSGGAAAGGLVGLAKGGMKSGGFVIPADVVSMVGEGNTDAGYSRIKSMIPGATAIKGKDGGQADTVKTSIEGKQPARVAHGEMYIPPETVKRMGGAKKLYAMMDRVRDQATGSKKQIRPVSLKKALA